MSMYDAIEDGGPDLHERLDVWIQNGDDPFHRIDELEKSLAEQGLKLRNVSEDFHAECERRREAERKLRAVQVAAEDAWLWQGDGSDESESLSDATPVVMEAGQLKAILQQRDAHWAAYVGTEAMLCASVTRERVTQQHRVDACDRERQLHDVLRVMEQDLARACSFLTNDFEPAVTERIFKLLELDQKRMLAGTERLKKAEAKAEELEERVEDAEAEQERFKEANEELQADVKFWQRVVVRARCGCLGVDCAKHGAFVAEESVRVLDELGLR